MAPALPTVNNVRVPLCPIVNDGTTSDAVTMRNLALLLIGTLLTSSLKALPPSAEEGQTPMRIYTAAEHGGHGQIWRVHQLPNQVIAFANFPGIGFFDGERFDHADVPGGAVYDFAVGPRQRIYVATGQVLGYLEPDSAHRWRHVALPLPPNAPAPGDIGRVICAHGSVWFLSRSVLLNYDADGSWHWRTTTQSYADLRWRDDQLLLFERGVGWLRFDLASKQFVPPPAAEATYTDLWASSEEPGEPWYATDRKALWRRISGRWSAFEVSDAAQLIDDRIESLARLPSGDLAVGTRFGGLYQYTATGQLRRRIAPELLPGERITDLSVDVEGALWMAIDGGLVRVEPDNRVTRFDRSAGASQIERIARIDDDLYLATRSGLKRLQAGARPGLPATFIDDRIRRTSTWDLLATAHGTLVATGAGVSLLPRNPTAAPVVVFASARVSALAPAADGWIYAVATNEVRRLRWRGQAFEVDPEVLRLVPMFDAVWHDGALWTSIDGGGVFRMAGLDRWPTPAIARFGAAEGVAEGRATFAVDAHGLLVFAAGKALHLGGDRFVPAPWFPAGLAIDRLTVSAPGRYWASRDQVGVRQLNLRPDGQYLLHSDPLARFRYPSRQVHVDADGTLWLGDDRGLLRMQSAPESAALTAPVLIRSVSSDGDQLWSSTAGTESLSRVLELPAAARSLQIQLALPSYQQDAATRWFMRVGDHPWTEFGGQQLSWSAPPGASTLEFRARDGQGRDSVPGELRLHVGRYWHETALARFLGLAALLLAMVASARSYASWRTRKLRLERDRLDVLIGERTAAVRRQADEIRLISEARTRFFANVSHEFRTPLTLIQGPLGDALEGRFGTLSQGLTTALETARASAQRLLHLVGELLDLSRLAAGRFDLRVAEHDLAEQLRRELAAFAPLAQQRGIELRSEGLADPLLIWYDADQLERMISNLLANALKFTPGGGHVCVRLVPAATEVGIEVEDDGPGIAAEEHAHVFERFYQGSASAISGAPGTGIGLALVRELIELHHGRAELISEPGQGSCFVLWLRRGNAHFQAVFEPVAPVLPSPRLAVGKPREAAELDVEPVPADLRPTVLVVDDHAELRRYLADRLGDAYQVVTAGDGDEALGIIGEALPDVVVSDVMMPGTNGLQLAHALRRDPETAGVPLLLLSARDHKRDIVAGLDAGADDYLSKPFDTSELIARIEALLASRRRLRLQQRVPAALAPAAVSANLDQEAPTPIESASQRFAERLARALEQDLGNPGFGVAELAAALHIDRATLFRRVRSSHQCTPSELLRESRLERAHHLLLAGSGSVSEVAYAVGFDNLSHFSQAFRKRYGVAPSSLLVP